MVGRRSTRALLVLDEATREAGRNTHWVDPNEAHERAVSEAIGRFYERLPEGFEELARRVAAEGRRVSLAHTLLKLTVPDLPDIYQGDELESLNLVVLGKNKVDEGGAYAIGPEYTDFQEFGTFTYS